MSNSKGTEAVKKALVSLSKKYPRNGHAFFSEALLEYQAADLCYRAIKDFIVKDFTNAGAKLQEAIRLDRNHLLYYWNLGRVLMLTKNISEAKRCYRDALTLVSLAPAHQKEKLETTLQKERNHFSPAKHSTPVLDVRL